MPNRPSRREPASAIPPGHARPATTSMPPSVAAALPGARLVEVPEAGHTVPGDQPAGFRALLEEFCG